VDTKPAPEETMICPLCGLELPAQLKKCPQDGGLLTARSAPPDPLIGTVVGGRYEILSLVGRGGMSVVYKARNRQVNSIVAVKTLKQDLLADEELFARFCQEAKVVQMLAHPNIVTVHDFGVTMDGQPFMAMDYLEGRTLADVLEESGRIGVKRCVRIFSQVCDALAHAHAHNMIHRDIKPGNIMLVDTVNDTDVVKIFDFGFAKFLEKPGRKLQALTQVGDVLGTPLYMSPEQSAGKKLDSRSDIYAVGCVMYESLTGRAPLIGENVLDTMQKQINEKPVALDTIRPDLFIPQPMTAILFKTLEKDPAARYQSMKDLKRDLEMTLMGQSGRAVVEADLPGLAKLKSYPEEKRYPQAMWISLAFGAVLMAGICWAFLLMSKPAETGAVDSSAITGEPLPIPQAQPRLSLISGPLPSDPKKLVEMARTFLKQQSPADSDKASSKAINILRSTGHTNDRSIADAYAINGEALLALSNFKKADSALQKALAIQQRELGPTHASVVNTLTLLARTAEGLGDYARADAYYKQATAIQSSR
jgi:serine/threonine-protein kinase